MRTYAETVLPSEDVQLFWLIQAVVREMPDPGLKVFSCHHLAHAFAFFFPVTALDGYSPSWGYEHSWLNTRHGNIIDVYPVGVVGGPILLAAGRYPDPWRHRSFSSW